MKACRMKEFSTLSPLLLLAVMVASISVVLGSGTYALTSAHSTWAYGQLFSVPLR